MPDRSGPENAGGVVVTALRKEFHRRGGAGPLTAVDDVSFEVPPGGSLAVVGESGSGKTTVAKMIVGLETPTSGTIAVGGRDRSRPAGSRAERRARGREVQIVFQDPYTSLDRRQTAEECIAEVLRFIGVSDVRFVPIGPTAGPPETAHAARQNAHRRLSDIAARF